MKAIKFASMFLLVALMSFSYSVKAQNPNPEPTVYSDNVHIVTGDSPETISFSVVYVGHWTLYPLLDYPTLDVTFQVVYKDRGNPIPKTTNVTVAINFQGPDTPPTYTTYTGQSIEPLGFGNHSIVSYSVVSSTIP